MRSASILTLTLLLGVSLAFQLKSATSTLSENPAHAHCKARCD